MSELSSSEIRHFRDMGYLRIKAEINQDVLTKMTSVIVSDFENMVPPYRINAQGNIARIDQLLDRDAVFLNTLRMPCILCPLVSLLGPNIEVAKFRHNHATKNLSGDIPFRLHRDIQQWSRPLVAVFIYLEDSVVDNGCTHLVPGSHFLPYAGPQSGDGGGNWADEHKEYEFLLRQSLPVPVARGDVLFVDCLTFHSVGRNTSNRSRLSAVFACHSVDEIYRVGVNEEKILLCGNRVYKGTDILVNSGSLDTP